MPKKCEKMVVVTNNVRDSFQLRQNNNASQNAAQNSNNKAQSMINSSVYCDPPVTSSMIYHQKKVRRKDSLSSQYSSVEIHRIQNQDPNLLNRPAWTDARIALLQIKKVIICYMLSILLMSVYVGCDRCSPIIS